MENLASEIFNILKGANMELSLFDPNGMKTTDAELASRFYSKSNDLMVSIREDNAKLEVLLQAGEGFDVTDNQNIVKILKKSAHKHMAEFTVRNFGKHIEPKDFAHQSVTEDFKGNVMSESQQKAFGSTKTSYVQFPASKLIIKHNKSVNEEVRGSRSRNIQSLYVENTSGERFKFPHKYMAGAKAMARHVSQGGTPYDEKGTSIIEMCEDIAELNAFVKHVRSNKLVNEDNSNIVETVRAELARLKEQIKSLSTQKGYNNFESYERRSVSEDLGVDIEQKFMHNTFTNKDMAQSVSMVGALVAEATKKEEMHKELLTRAIELIKSGADLKVTIDANDPEHPDNEDQVKYSGSQGPMAKLSGMLGYIAMNSKNDELFNLLSELSTQIHDMPKPMVEVVAKLVAYITAKAQKNEDVSVETTTSLVAETELNMRKKIS